jgi:hypothetical protein
MLTALPSMSVLAASKLRSLPPPPLLLLLLPLPVAEDEERPATLPCHVSACAASRCSENTACVTFQESTRTQLSPFASYKGLAASG